MEEAGYFGNWLINRDYEEGLAFHYGGTNEG